MASRQYRLDAVSCCPDVASIELPAINAFSGVASVGS